jgi:hypothetical protein
MARTDNSAGNQYAKAGLITGRQGIYEESATAKHTIGERLVLGDGRVFYYAKNSTQATTYPSSVFVADCDVGEDDSAVTESIGDKNIGFTTVGAFGTESMAGGYLVSSAGTGSGQTYKIADVSGCSTTGDSMIYLHDGIKVAFSSADCIAYNNIFFNVERSADENAFALGIALIPVTASYYFWLQTWGWCVLKNTDGIGDAADEREIFLGTSGMSVLSTAGGALGKQVIGYNAYYADDNTANEYHFAYLTCIP